MQYASSELRHMSRTDSLELSGDREYLRLLKQVLKLAHVGSDNPRQPDPTHLKVYVIVLERSNLTAPSLNSRRSTQRERDRVKRAWLDVIKRLQDNGTSMLQDRLSAKPPWRDSPRSQNGTRAKTDRTHHLPAQDAKALENRLRHEPTARVAEKVVRLSSRIMLRAILIIADPSKAH